MTPSPHGAAEAPGAATSRILPIAAGVIVGGGVVFLSALGYEHFVDLLGLYEWQDLEEPSRRTILFLAGLLIVSVTAGFSGLWVGRVLSDRRSAERR